MSSLKYREKRCYWCPPLQMVISLASWCITTLDTAICYHTAGKLITNTPLASKGHYASGLYTPLVTDESELSAFEYLSENEFASDRSNVEPDLDAEAFAGAMGFMCTVSHWWQ